ETRGWLSMNDYGYRSEPPPENGRLSGDAGHSGGAHGSASPRHRSYGNGSNSPPDNPDYSWGGGTPQQGAGPYGNHPAPRPGSYGGTGRASVGSASVGGASGSASVG